MLEGSKYNKKEEKRSRVWDFGNSGEELECMDYSFRWASLRGNIGAKIWN